MEHKRSREPTSEPFRVASQPFGCEPTLMSAVARPSLLAWALLAVPAEAGLGVVFTVYKNYTDRQAKVEAYEKI